MLIDATYPDEARVVVVSGNRVEEFDYETANRKQLKGNIYLAKVTRVEPSLQAAFVEYGGNRHGFLPFSEIHPDYYRIPISDRDALIAEEQELPVEAAPEEQNGELDYPESAIDRAAYQDVPDEPDNGNGDRSEAANGAGNDTQAETDGNGNGSVEEVEPEADIDTVGGDEIEDTARRRAKLMRRYKIQEVVKRRQVVLVQVTKEERGNKGAALTTYLSLAGRYCVLMPNTAKGGGISRKISNSTDRRRLKSVLAELSIPEGVAVIVRTAGASRTKAEIRRDYEYLLRLWDEIRNKTLQSTAPCLIHEEANLIKRSIRDLYDREMEEVLVQGDDGYKSAKGFMKMLMPSHAKKVQPYGDATMPLFHRFQVESQLDAMHETTVQLRSGGSIVLNQTEALVAIDVNSGKATRERHIEETALRTNVEAAAEIARQLRLRDLAGLIVIDFIDMDETRNNREVERRLKEAMRGDRARIQLGRISPFGLLEMSRQRLRPSLFETATDHCPVCQGTGHVRSADSAALAILRMLTEEGLRRGGGEVEIKAPTAVALYLLNEKRRHLLEIEQRFELTISVRAADDLKTADYEIRRLASYGKAPVQAEAPPVVESDEAPRDGEGERTRRRSRRGGRRRRKEAPEADEDLAAESVSEERLVEAAEDGEAEEGRGKRRRRGKRGGRRRGRRRDEATAVTEAPGEAAAVASEPTSHETTEPTDSTDAAAGDAAASDAAPAESAAAIETAAETAAETTPEPTEPTAEATAAPEAEAADTKPKKPTRRRTRRKPAASEPEAPAGDGAAEATTEAPPSPDADDSDGAAAAPVGGEAPSEEPTAKPKRTRRSPAAPRRKTAAKRAATPAEETDQGEPETPAPTDEAESPPREPANARVPDAGPTQNIAAAAAGESESETIEVVEDVAPPKPKRRGWWSRAEG
jgi:ribonuclease E